MIFQAVDLFSKSAYVRFMSTKGQTQMNHIDSTKLRILTNTLEENSPHFALGWMQSMIGAMDTRLNLSKKQIKMLNEMLDENIRWASQAK